MREVSKRPYGARLMDQTSQALVGDIIAVDLPDPIPNSEVKHQQAHGTAGVTLWESRYRRPQSLKPSVESQDSRGLFHFRWGVFSRGGAEAAGAPRGAGE